MLYYRILLLLLLAIGLFSNDWLPPEWGWENGVIEWSQVIILSLGLILSWNKSSSSFGLFATPVWLIMIGRELSWGRVFFPIGIDQAGPYFPSLKELWYGPAVYPTVTVILLIWLWAIIKYKLYMIPIRMIKQGGFPWTNLLLVFLSAVTAYVSEKHLDRPVSEEFCELIAYIGLVVLSLEFKNIILHSKNKLLVLSNISHKKSI
ncbi:MAG: hypothetical protein ACOYD5_11990 [Negativicutes bacterium]|jgi:hypothetical protein